MLRRSPIGRDRARVVHTLSDILRARILAIASGYEDADDLDHLRSDPALKLACGHLPDSGRDLCSQPTMSRWENAPSLRDANRLMRVMVALYTDSAEIRKTACQPGVKRFCLMDDPPRLPGQRIAPRPD